MISQLDRSRRFLVVAGALVTAAAALPAQSPVADARWQGWLGCWQTAIDPLAPPANSSLAAARALEALGVPAAATPATPSSQAPMVCIVPATGRSAVDVVSLTDGKVVSRERVEATGERLPISRDGCTGWQQATWSSDGERVFLKSEIGCGPGLTRTTSGVLAMSPMGEWLDVQGLQAGGNNGVRVARYRAIGLPAGLPADIAQLSASSQLASQAARFAAGAPVNPRDVIEATKQVDAPVVQSWLAELGQHFQLDAGTLVQMADAGVPGSVTDMMVAVSYPAQFAVRQPAGAPMESFSTERDSARIASEYLRGRGCGSLDPFAYSPYGWGLASDPYYASSAGCSRYGYGRYSPYSRYYSPYSSAYGYGYSPYYYGSGYVTSVPVIVVRGDETPHGRVVNGRGYTRPTSDGSASGTTSSRGTSSGGSSAGSSSSGSTGSSAGSSSSGSGSSSSGRTAIPRPPST